MTHLSIDELNEISSYVGVEFFDGESARVGDSVERLLDGLDTVNDVALPDTRRTGSERGWHEPADDPHNIISHYCHVPPAEENTGELDDVSMGIKDIIAVAGVPMECGSEVMAGYVPGTDATVVDRLLTAGANITAKLRLDEFAGSARGTTGSGPPISNPHDPERTAGGSSGGSAAAVALHEVDTALGTDTGGSVRIPAAFCGVVGLKPTYGVVPLTGVVENTYTLDHVGILSNTVDEAATTLDVIAGKDTHDPASLSAAGRENYKSGESSGNIDSLRLGVINEGTDNIAEPTIEHFRGTLDEIRDAGASVQSVSIDHFSHAKSIKNILSLVEIATHWRDGGASYRRGSIVDRGYQTALASRSQAANHTLGSFYKAKILAGGHLITNDGGRKYTRAQAAREVLAQEVTNSVSGIDALILPTTPNVAPPIDIADDPGFDYARNTRFANVTRHPAITLPGGRIDKLPIGIQIVGSAFDDAKLLSVANTLEQWLE